MKRQKEKHSDKIDNLVNINPKHDSQTMEPEEVSADKKASKSTLYDSSWYKTASGHWKQNDEPGEPKKTEYLTIAPDAFQKQKQWNARQRLKSKDAVPTKGGKKLFNSFMQEAGRRTSHFSKNAAIA